MFFEQIWSQKRKFSKMAEIWHNVPCYLLISKLMFIFSVFSSFIFFGKLWSQNLKFLKLIEIWYRGTLLCSYNVLMFIFPKLFWQNSLLKISYTQVAFVLILHPKHFFGKFGPIIWISLNWLKFCGGGHCYARIRILIFIFSKLLYNRYMKNYSYKILRKCGPKI